jgi:hypothetical protein
MKKLLLAGVAAAGVALAASGAQAGLLLGAPTGAPGGAQTPGVIPGTTGASSINNGLGPLGFVNPLGGHYGAQLYSKGGNVRFEFLGFEAGAQNRFIYNPGGAGTFTFDTETPPLNLSSNAWNAAGFASQTRNVAAGVINFRFVTGGNLNNVNNRVDNGKNPFEDPANALAVNLNFFISFGPPPGAQSAGGPTSGDVAYVWFDDRGGTRGPNICGPQQNKACPDDDNHDDMVIRITYVPEPATIALFGAGLLGLGAAMRRRRKV